MVRIIIIDPKQLDFTMFEGLPHLEPHGKVIHKTTAADKILSEILKLIEIRKQKITGIALNVKSYNEIVDENERIPYVVVIIDEYADFLLSFKDKKKRDELEEKICRIAQISRALGIRLVLATQRPEANIVTGLIKANFPARIAFTVRDHVNSTMIIDETGAENLLGQGDMLFSNDGSSPLRYQGFFLDNQEIKEITKLICDKVKREEPLFSGDLINNTNPYQHTVLPKSLESPLTLRPGEFSFLFFDAAFLEAKEFKEIQGPRWHIGLGKRLSKGLGVGGGVSFGTKKIISETKLDDIDAGTVVLTNKRIVFIGSMFAEECLYSDIIDYHIDNDNLILFLSKRRKAMCFSFNGKIFVSKYSDIVDPSVSSLVRTSMENLEYVLKCLMYLSFDPGIDKLNFNDHDNYTIVNIN